MARIETPTGSKVVRETKTFMQVQTENAAKLKAGTVTSVTCGMEAEPTLVPTPKRTTSLEKVNG